MSGANFYGTSTTNRTRRTRCQMDTLCASLLAIVNGGEGMTVRHLFYRMVAAGAIEKTETAYRRISTLAVALRRSGDIAFGKLIDGSRLYTAPTTYNGIRDAIDDTATIYRRDYWRHADRVVEVWCEKDAIRALIQPITYAAGVPLMVTRGFSSESVIQSLAEETKRSGKPRVILALNDYDQSGALMLADIIRRATHYAPKAEFQCEQVCLTREQVEEFRLPTRPTKRENNPHARRFADEQSVELDALEPETLRQLLRDAIDTYIDPDVLNVVERAEASERQWLQRLAATIT